MVTIWNFLAITSKTPEEICRAQVLIQPGSQAKEIYRDFIKNCTLNFKDLLATWANGFENCGAYT